MQHPSLTRGNRRTIYGVLLLTLFHLFSLLVCQLARLHGNLEFRRKSADSRPVTVKNIPTREIIPPVYFRVRKSVKNIPGVCFCIRQNYTRYIFAYENQSKTYPGYVLHQAKLYPPITYLLSENIPPILSRVYYKIPGTPVTVKNIPTTCPAVSAAKCHTSEP